MSDVAYRADTIVDKVIREKNSQTKVQGRNLSLI